MADYYEELVVEVTNGDEVFGSNADVVPVQASFKIKDDSCLPQN